MVKRIFLYGFFIIVLAIPMNGVSKDTPGGNILVLGFKSVHLDDLQDRLLREAILRGLIDRGYRIVPVMEMERYFKSRSNSIRDIDISKLKELCDEFEAAYAVTGSMARKKRSYVFSIIIYERAMENVNGSTISISDKEMFMNYCIPLSGEIVDKIEGVVK
jgi:hypothetical protein